MANRNFKGVQALNRGVVLIAGRATDVANVVLTGTIDPTASTSVVGSGTQFLTELAVGDSILVSSETRVVATITSATALTVTAAFSNNGNDTSPEKLSDPTTDGLGFGVKKNGDGDYTVNLEDKYTSLLHAGVTYRGATDQTFAQLHAHDVTSAKTAQFKFYDDAGAAQALAAADEFTFMLALRNSTVP